MSDYAAVRLDEIEELDDGRCAWRPVAAHLGITSFGVNSWTARNAGDRVINEHVEGEPGDGDEELYVVIAGRARFELDGEVRDAPAGTAVYVRPAVKRTAFAEEPGTTILALGAVPGKAYQPHPGSIWGPLNPLYEAGRYEEVLAGAAPLLAAYPDHAGLLYNVACVESLAGRTEDALDHVERAAELADQFRTMAREDSDFDPIREEPRFRALVGE